jgi:hypothetical protein
MPAVTVVDVTVTDTTLPKVPASLMPDYPDYEAGAIDHWLFDKGSSSSLIGTKSGLVLTPTGLAPTYPGAYLTLPGGGVSALTTPFDDNAVGTECFVFRHHAAAGLFSILLGSETGSAGAGGEFLFVNNLGRFADFPRGYSSALDAGSGSAPADVWLFGAVSRTATDRTIYISAGSGPLKTATKTGAKTLATPMRKMAVGNAYRTQAGYTETPLDLAEFIPFPDAKDATAISSIFTRSKERMADRGLVLA